MDINLVTEWLLDNKYIYKSAKGGFLLTPKYHKDLKDSAKQVVSVVKQEVVVINQEDVRPLPEKYNLYNYKHWTDFYVQFIQDCKVPAFIEGTNMNRYSTNKYSEEGMKSFQKALKDGYRYDVLMMAVALYYKSAIRLKKAIGTYMVSGEWRSDYNELLDKANDGKLETHIKQTIDDGTGTNFEFG